MKIFLGFSPGGSGTTPLPSQFFSDLLPAIDHLGELKVTLYAFWCLGQQEGERRFLRLSEMKRDEILQSALAGGAAEPGSMLEESLERAVSRGTLLHVPRLSADPSEHFYFLNTPKGRAAADSLERGEWSPDPGSQLPRLAMERPNVFRRYEEDIGPLTPHMAEVLRDAEKEYPPGWIEEAIGLAVERNVRSWRYVSAILERWKAEGKRDSGRQELSTRRYVEGEYSDHIEH
ncbi:MAG: DnaD domain protein [Anaerolineales bacterium]|jgi:DnaD/phage-associated family protein